jgi:hypothetical protein
MRKKIYIGIKFRNEQALPPIYELFRSAETPTDATHGQTYGASIGPFRTVRGAKFMRDHGHNNPHCVTVSQAETLAKAEHTHKWGPLEQSRLAGTTHRKCTIPGCNQISALDDDE